MTNAYQQALENIPDGIKVGTAVSAPMLNLFGVPIEEWTFILSAIVSLLFIIEKLPIFILRCKTFVRWLKERK